MVTGREHVLSDGEPFSASSCFVLIVLRSLNIDHDHHYERWSFMNRGQGQESQKTFV